MRRPIRVRQRDVDVLAGRRHEPATGVLRHRHRERVRRTDLIRRVRSDLDLRPDPVLGRVVAVHMARRRLTRRPSQRTPPDSQRRRCLHRVITRVGRGRVHRAGAERRSRSCSCCPRLNVPTCAPTNASVSIVPFGAFDVAGPEPLLTITCAVNVCVVLIGFVADRRGDLDVRVDERLDRVTAVGADAVGRRP